MTDDDRKKWDELCKRIPTWEEMEDTIKELKESGIAEDLDWEEKFKQSGKEFSELLEQIKRRLKL